MVVEIAGSTIIMVSAAAAAIIATAAMIEAASTYDTNAITNIGVNVWDRFPAGSHLAWVEVTMTYHGGYLEVAGDIPLCLVPPDGATDCPLSGRPPERRCDDATLNNTRHGCWSSRLAGSALQVRYEGVANVGVDVDRGDPLGYVVSGLLHSSSGMVGVR